MSERVSEAFGDGPRVLRCDHSGGQLFGSAVAD
jgi:hypothetical protein